MSTPSTTCVREYWPSRMSLQWCAPCIILSRLFYESLTGKQMQKSLLSLQNHNVVHIFVFVGQRKVLDFTQTVILLKCKMLKFFFSVSSLMRFLPAALLCLLVLFSSLRSLSTVLQTRGNNMVDLPTWLLFVKLLTDKY